MTSKTGRIGAGLLGALTVYAIAGLTVPLLLAFVAGIFEPLSIDGVSPGIGDGRVASGALWAFFIDGALLLYFALQHSLMARESWKCQLGRLRALGLERSAYVLMSCLSVVLLVAAWRPFGPVIWSVGSEVARGMLWTLFLLGCALVYWSAFALDHFELLGVRSAVAALLYGTTSPSFTRRGPYRHLRHPMMLGLLVAFWAAPRMTAGHLLFAAVQTIYVLVGTRLEERDLARRGAGLVPACRPALRPRSRSFDFEAPHLTLWYRGSAFRTQLLNGYSAVFPTIERFMIRRLRRLAKRIADPALAEQLCGLLAQEATHAAQHDRASVLLTQQGFRLARVLRMIGDFFARLIEPLLDRVVEPWLGRGLDLAVIAGVEHWTAAIAELHLRLDLGCDLDSAMKHLFYWHGAEELEHKAVAFDVLRHLHPSYLLRLVGFVIATITLGMLTLLMTGTLLKQSAGPARRRLLRDLFRYLFWDERAAPFLLGRAACYLLPSFHPDQIDTGALIERGLSA